MKKSAIMQMYLSKRGCEATVPISEGYKECQKVLNQRDKEMTEKLQNYPELLKLYQKVIEVESALEGEASDMHYYEGFSFGLMMGIEAGMR